MFEKDGYLGGMGKERRRGGAYRYFQVIGDGPVLGGMVVLVSLHYRRNTVTIHKGEREG